MDHISSDPPRAPEAEARLQDVGAVGAIARACPTEPNPAAPLVSPPETHDPRDPLVPGNARWERENARRAWLINKLVDMGLSDEEDREYQEIEFRFTEASDRFFPRLGPSDEEMAQLREILDPARGPA